MSRKAANPLIENSRGILREFWENPSLPERSEIDIPSDISDAIGRSINSTTLTYRYVLPTQLLAKTADPTLDCRAVQAGARLPGAFDARSLCHGVIVEFDREQNSVLGGSKEPYLNNPLRIQAITDEFRAPQKDKQGFDDLRAVLEFAEKFPEAAPELLQLTLTSIRRRLESVAIVYPAPNRVSFQQTREVVGQFLDFRSGGARMQAVAVALFLAIGERFQLFAAVRAGNVNAADAQTGVTADLECIDGDDSVVLVVEVKDRSLTLRQVQDKLPAMREKGIREMNFLVQGGVEPESENSVREGIERQFNTGQNLYVCEFLPFLDACLVLFAEAGRRCFLLAIGEELDRQRADFVHRDAWRNLLHGL